MITINEFAQLFGLSLVPYFAFLLVYTFKRELFVKRLLVLNTVFSMFLLGLIFYSNTFTATGTDKLVLLFTKSDILNDYSSGYNWLHGKGFVTDYPVYSCFNPPCEGKNRQPLNAIILGGFGSVYFVIPLVLIFLLICLLLIYVLSGGSKWAVLMFLLIPVVCGVFVQLNYEFMHLVIFICCMETAKCSGKNGFWFALSASLMVLARLSLGIGVIAAAFILNNHRKWLIIPGLVMLLYMFWGGLGGSNLHYQQNFAVWENSIMDVFHGNLVLPEFTLLEKAARVLFTFDLYILGIPVMFLLVFPFIVFSELKKFHVFVWLSWLFSCLVFSFFGYGARYEFILLTLLIYVNWWGKE